MKPRIPPFTGLLFLSCHSQMPFQVVELRLDAVDTIKKLIARLDKAHYEAERDFWSAVAKDGKTRLKFVIEGV